MGRSTLAEQFAWQLTTTCLRLPSFPCADGIAQAFLPRLGRMLRRAFVSGGQTAEVSPQWVGVRVGRLQVSDLLLHLHSSELGLVCGSTG